MSKQRSKVRGSSYIPEKLVSSDGYCSFQPEARKFFCFQIIIQKQ